VNVVVIGATGTVGSAVVDALRGQHSVIAASRRSDPQVDLSDPSSVASFFERVKDADAVICCAASAPLNAIPETPYEDFVRDITAKMLGQVAVALNAAASLRDNGSITLTSGKIPEGLRGGAGGALVNAGLEAFVQAAAPELERGLRLNAVSPGWVSESLAELGMDASEGTPAREVAPAYVEALEGSMSGEVLRPGA
jgi:NAD(P)-dependent dehydrogenase (short-subunit alcohol dehydrogenase family)